MARNKSTSKVEQQYRKERKRIQRQMNRMLARGYILPEVLPPIPKKITAGSVRRLKKITTKKLYDMADFQDLTTGEVVSGQEGRKLERKRTAKKSAETRRRRREEQPEVPQVPETPTEPLAPEPSQQEQQIQDHSQDPWNSQWRMGAEWIEQIPHDIAAKGASKCADLFQQMLDSFITMHDEDGLGEYYLGLAVVQGGESVREAVQECIDAASDHYAGLMNFTGKLSNLSRLLDVPMPSADEIDKATQQDSAVNPDLL